MHPGQPPPHILFWANNHTLILTEPRQNSDRAGLQWWQNKSKQTLSEWCGEWLDVLRTEESSHHTLTQTPNGIHYLIIKNPVLSFFLPKLKVFSRNGTSLLSTYTVSNNGQTFPSYIHFSMFSYFGPLWNCVCTIWRTCDLQRQTLIVLQEKVIFF